MKLQNYFLIFGLIIAVLFSGCEKDDKADPTEITKSTPPKIEVNGKATGNIIDVPLNAQEANDNQFQSVASEINQIGTFITKLNDIPAEATTDQINSSTVEYYWLNITNGVTTEVWYLVEESGFNYNLTYDIAISNTNYPDSSITRTNFITGVVSQNGINGDLTFNAGIFSPGLSYHYAWNTNTLGTLHIEADFILGTLSPYTNIHYEANLYAAGHGEIDYTFTDSEDNDGISHYEWNSSWTIVTFTFSYNGINISNTWNA